MYGNTQQPQPSTSRSPPPGGPTLQHPVPTHPMYIPEPPTTPISPQGYQRYTSSPQPHGHGHGHGQGGGGAMQGGLQGQGGLGGMGQGMHSALNQSTSPANGFGGGGAIGKGGMGMGAGAGTGAGLGVGMGGGPGGSGYAGSPPQGFAGAQGQGISGFMPQQQQSDFIHGGAGQQQSGFGYPQFQSFGVQGMMNPQGTQPGLGQGQPGFGVPDFSAWGVNPATAQFGMALGQNAMAAGTEYMQKNFGLGATIPIISLKQHFAVSNSYVMRKLQLLLFPWRRKYRWARRVTRNEQGHAEWQTPREDLNSPDLYIPVMAFVTYVLVAAVHRGVQERFHPEVLGITASRALAVAFIDVLLVKGGCYILNVQGPGQMLDLISYAGYKFVGVILVLIASLLHIGGFTFVAVFAYAFLAQGFFLLRSLRSVILPDPANTPANVGIVSNAARSRRIMFLFAVAGSQLLYMGILARV